jgi:hypothetical protein
MTVALRKINFVLLKSAGENKTFATQKLLGRLKNTSRKTQKRILKKQNTSIYGKPSLTALGDPPEDFATRSDSPTSLADSMRLTLRRLPDELAADKSIDGANEDEVPSS